MTQPIERPSKEDFAQWKNAPAGRWFFTFLQAKFNHESERVLFGGTLNSESAEATAINTARATARLDLLHEIGVRVNYNEICEQLGIEVNEEDTDSSL